MTTTKISQHEDWVDWAKVLLIFFVIVGHAGNTGFSQDLIYSFHMPAFFVISGYLYHPKDWKKTCKRLLIPVAFYSAIHLCFMILMDYAKTGYVDITHYAKDSWGAFFSVAWPNEDHVTLFVGVWFIIVLLLCRLLLGDILAFSFVRCHYHYIAFFMTTWMIAEPFILGSYTSPVQDLYIYRCLSCFPFIALGLHLQDYPDHKKNVLAAKWPWISVGVILVFAMTLHNGYVSVWANQYGNNVIIYFVNGCTASLLLFSLLTHLKRSKVIETLSKGTLLILGIHYMCITLGRTPCKWIGIYDTPFAPWLVAVSTLAISYYPIRFFIKHRIPLI